ncbi:MAG TPA: DUF1697 domain-containing protein [Candidatus Sulfotelmatobacter sp.]|nr:DUF1697 domain-containing protein [Candidatus Sulfotelmatobacter sp.]
MKYAAFIRGVGPENPNMHGAKLKEFFEDLGFTNVHAVISSGNVVFETDKKGDINLEKFIEENLPIKLGFTRAVIIRSQNELKDLVKADHFKGVKDSPTSKLNITFLKKGGEVFTIINPEVKGTTKVMYDLEKQYGKDVTTRTLGTIEKILKKME